jgi:hypothetical protein
MSFLAAAPGVARPVALSSSRSTEFQYQALHPVQRRARVALLVGDVDRARPPPLALATVRHSFSGAEVEKLPLVRPLHDGRTLSRPGMAGLSAMPISSP